MEALSFLTGYLDKVAADPEYDLPSGAWYKALLQGLSKHQSGRAMALSESQGKKAPWLTRHSYLGDLAAGVGGGVAGGIGGGILAGATGKGPEEAGMYGAIGGLGGMAAAIITLALVRQSQTKAISKGFTKPDPAKLREAIDRIATKGAITTGTKGLITGSYDLGRASQLSNLADKKPGEIKSGYVAGAMPMATGAVGGAAASGGGPFVGAGLESLVNSIMALKGRNIARNAA